jgi:hypothetical protein
MLTSISINSYQTKYLKLNINQIRNLNDAYLFRHLLNLFCIMLFIKSIAWFSKSRACAIESEQRYLLLFSIKENRRHGRVKNSKQTRD